MLNFFKKAIAVIATSAVLFGFGINTSEAATSGSIGNGECTARISQSLLNQRSYKTATVRLNLKAYGRNASNAVVYVVMRDERGNVIWEGNHSGGTLKLGNDHAVYRISIHNPRGVGPLAQEWSISNEKGCTIE